MDIGFSSMILMSQLIKINPKEDYVMQWHTQASIITTNLKVKIDFTLPEIIVIKILTWGFNVDGSAKDIYDMFLGIDILISFGFNLKLSDRIIEAYYGPLKGLAAPMVDLGTYEFKDLNTGKFTPE